MTLKNFIDPTDDRAARIKKEINTDLTECCFSFITLKDQNMKREKIFAKYEHQLSRHEIEKIFGELEKPSTFLLGWELD
jgi:hypothetical protein